MRRSEAADNLLSTEEWCFEGVEEAGVGEGGASGN